MKTITKISSVLVPLFLAAGCATDQTNVQPNAELTTIQSELNRALEQKNQLQSEIDQTKNRLQTLSAQNQTLLAQQASGSSDLMPPNAKPGECFARVLIPAQYKTETKEVVKREAGYRIETTKPVYEWVSEKVLVKEESEIAEVIPARYEWRTEKVLVRDAYDELKTIPAVYETKTEKILVKPAYTTWKKGRGPIEKLNNATGEIMCLVEVPAQYRTVTSRVMVTPPHTEKIHHPAVYKDVKKRVMVEEPKMVKKTIPAVYKTIKVKKLIKPAEEVRVEIPAVYETVTTRVKVSDSYLEWRNILCETNTTGDVIRSLQQALKAAGYNPGPIDGILGKETMAALKQYQKDKHLASGQLTLETLKSLNISY